EGQWLWADRFGGVNADLGSSIALDSTGNIYLTGFFNTTAYFGNKALASSGGYDAFAAKLSPSGSWLWVRKAGGAGFDEGLGISLDANSNVFLAGRFTGTANFGSVTLTSASSDFSDAFLGKLNSAGDWQWAVRAGGIDQDYGYGVVAHGDSEALLCGYFCQSSDFSGTTLTSAGLSDAFFARIMPPPPTLTLLSFTGGDSYPANTVQRINWASSRIDSVRLDYSLDGGFTWNPINNGEAVPATLCSCEWNLPNLDNYQAKVRVSDSVNPQLVADSDTTFAIIVPPVPPEEVQVGINEENPQHFTISWEPVTMNQNGESVVPDGYRIYYCSEFNGDSTVFLLLAEVRDGTSYTHNNATLDFDNLFYKIVAFKE
ncbi:MAG TPA: SBBP repeat-containing protein, partial [Candidatus Cloacimonadota bacterium]|nr:SBBP repeat-containing protein [Candidatus Cloacimonadota bacterium]